MRVENNGPVYSSFAEYAKANNIEPASKVNKDKLDERKEKFLSHHKCRACGQVMQYVYGTNVVRCTNPTCRGIKHTRKDKEGNDIVTYSPSFDLLEDKYAKIAMNLFA